MIINLGWASGTIAEQLEKEGIKFDKKKIEHLEKVKDSISVLFMAGYITYTKRVKFMNQLTKDINRAIKEK